METYFFGLSVLSFTLEGLILLRGREGGLLRRFPFFYAYVAFVLLGSASAYIIVYQVQPHFYPTAYWFYFMATLVAEFAVLVEVSDHIFLPYPPIRRLGRLLALGICGTFLVFYIIPSLMEHRPSSVAILDLVKRTSLTKAVIIIVLLAAVRYYRLPLGRNVSGMLLGFSIYLGTNVANFALAEEFGPALYYQTFVIVLPLSYTLSLLVWTIALWRYEPVLPIGHNVREGDKETSQPLSYQLGRFNTALVKLLRR